MNKLIESIAPRKQALGRSPQDKASEGALVDRLMDFDRARIQHILKESELPSSGAKLELRAIIEQNLKNGNLTYNQIADHIFGWEPWTHRHCYFIKANPKDLAHLKSPNGLRKALRDNELESRLAAGRNFFIPGSMTLDTVGVADDVLTVTFVAPLYTYEHVETRYDEPTQTRHKIEHLKVSRKVYMLELSLKSGRGFLSIPAVQRGKSYSKEFAAIEKTVKKILAIGAFEIVPIEGAIHKLMNSDSSISNAIHVRLSSGRKVQVKSPSKKTPVFDNTTKQLERAVAGHYMEGAFYYAEDPEKPEFRYKIHDDHRLGIFSDLDEQEFRDVMELVLGNL